MISKSISQIRKGSNDDGLTDAALAYGIRGVREVMHPKKLLRGLRVGLQEFDRNTASATTPRP